ncbi:MAG: Trm112 family protein [Thermodesulfobacteriota bacterium]
MISEDLLNVIACPETKQDLVIAGDDLVEKINLLIESGELLDRAKQQVTEKIDGGFIQKDDQNYLYPIRDDIPILLIDESISLENVS